GARKYRWASGAMLFCAFVLICNVASAQKPAMGRNANKGVDLRQHPMGGKSPVEVALGMHITNLVSIDETRESFEVVCYLMAKWKDWRLAADPALGNPDGTGVRKFEVEELWTPAVETANSISHRGLSHMLEADRDGVVTYVERFGAVLSEDYELRKFPFDRQT